MLLREPRLFLSEPLQTISDMLTGLAERRAVQRGRGPLARGHGAACHAVQEIGVAHNKHESFVVVVVGPLPNVAVWVAGRGVSHL